MTEFAHKFDSKTAAFETFARRSAENGAAAFTLMLNTEDGKVLTVDSDECPAYKDQHTTENAAMFSIKGYGDFCDVYHYGEYWGTAHYEDMTPNSWFSSMQVVFSTQF